MNYIILTKEQADDIRGMYGEYNALEPVPLPDGTFTIPEDCIDNPAFESVKEYLDLIPVRTEIPMLPPIGEECVKDQIYNYESEDENDYQGLVKCVQTHNRTIYKPIETPALFSFFRSNSDDLPWIENEYVYVGWKRMYNDKQYEVIQEHMTLSTWTPEATLNVLWKLVSIVGEEWQAGISYTIDQEVTYLGLRYKCRQSHTSQVGWEPPNVLALWLPI